jgi:phosphoglucomutase
VGLARKLREDGYIVRILGEGSSGGTIIHPSSVRDPIDTLGAILKLLAIRSGYENSKPGLFKIWCKLSGQIYKENFTLADILSSLPAFITTGSYTEDALLRVKVRDHALLKDNYQKIFLQQWEERKFELSDRWGITEWEVVAYNGMTEKPGISRFGEAGSGGLKIIFYGADHSGEKAQIACIWMRGSGTEPVFRVMADAALPDTHFERYLIEWQRRMVLEANNKSA